jgi:hypothetical protein
MSGVLESFPLWLVISNVPAAMELLPRKVLAAERVR